MVTLTRPEGASDFSKLTLCVLTSEAQFRSPNGIAPVCSFQKCVLSPAECTANYNKINEPPHAGLELATLGSTNNFGAEQKPRFPFSPVAKFTLSGCSIHRNSLLQTAEFGGKLKFQNGA